MSRALISPLRWEFHRASANSHGEEKALIGAGRPQSCSVTA